MINRNLNIKVEEDVLNNIDERNYAEKLVEKYGKDSLDYLTLENDKKYFFGIKVQGFIAYLELEKVAVCIGNPICLKYDTVDLLNEFKEFCNKKHLKICFCSVDEDVALVLKEKGFSISKYGEEAFLDLNEYNLKGSKASKLRQKINRAEKSGITILEYNPTEKRNFKLEEKINKISHEWLSNKGGKLTFTLGELNLDNPLDRRYFIALNKNDEIEAILTFTPFYNNSAYFLDIMRRKPDAVPGVMEKAIIDAAMKMKEDGVQWISLGLAPLAGIEINENSTLLEKGMNFVYNNMNSDYGFKSLHDYKRKFAPSFWDNRYIAHDKSLSAIKVGYVMIKAKSVKRVWKQIIIGILQGGKSLMTTKGE